MKSGRAKNIIIFIYVYVDLKLVNQNQTQLGHFRLMCNEMYDLCDSVQV